MALPDLTGQNIQDTYQRVLQTDNGTLRDGTGSLITNVGIGTTIPDEALHVVGGNNIALFSRTQGLGGSFANILIHASNGDPSITFDGDDTKHTLAHNDGDGSFQIYEGATTSGTARFTLDSSGNITASGNISTNNTGSFGRVICTTISASTGEFDANTIFIGGTSFNKGDLDDLKEGKTINTLTKDLGGSDTNKTNIVRPDAIMSPVDDSTYSKFTVAGKIGTFVSGTLFHELNLNGSSNSITMGNGTTNLTLSGSINEATLDGGTF